MEKSCKILLWIVCTTAIIAALGVAIYFIVVQALDNKAESCLFKHFQTTGLLTKYNVSMSDDPAKNKYSTEECQSYVDRVRSKTLKRINETDTIDCIKNQLRDNHIEEMMLKGVLEKFKRNSTSVTGAVFGASKKACIPTPVIHN